MEKSKTGLQRFRVSMKVRFVAIPVGPSVRFVTGTPHAVKHSIWFTLDYGIQHWREVKRRGNEEQTAHLQTALLHLLCGPRYEPLGGAPFAKRAYANAFP